MSDEQTARLGIQVDGSGAKAGFDEIKRDARDMATSVSNAGQQAAKGVDAIGAGSQVAADKLDRNTKSIIGSVQRATAAIEAGQKGSAKYFETLANQRGANLEALRPYLAQLDEAKRKQEALNQAMHGTGVSAAQTAAALRGVPAQFTDIVTSLQGGQAPLTVLLQQGGQLKDMFGGIGPAAKALGGFVLGLVNPFTLAAGAAVGLGYAYKLASDEADAFAKSLVLSGNAAGTTAGQMSQMAKRIGDSIGSQSGAADALVALAESGRIGSASMEKLAESAIRFERAGGQAASETAKQFAELAKEPLAASLKLNESTNYLTESAYRQIKALSDQGRTTEAATAAVNAYYDAVESRTPELEQSLGRMQTGWRSLKDAVSGALQPLKDLNTPDTPEDQLRRVQNMIANKRGYPERNPGTRAGAQVAEELRGLEQTERILLSQIGAQVRLGAERQRAVEQERARAQWLKESDKYLTKEERLQRDLTRIRNEGDAAGVDAEEIKRRQAFVREAARDKSGDRDGKKSAKEIERSLGLYGDLFNEQAGLASNFTEQVQLLQKGLAAGKFTVEGYTEAYKALLATQPFAIKQAREQADEERRLQDERSKAAKQVFDLLDDQARGAQRGAQAIADRVLALRDEEEALQTSRLMNISLAEAIERVQIARLKERVNAASGSDRDAYVRALNDEIEAREKLAALAGRKAERDKAEDAFKSFMGSDVGADFAAGFDRASASMGTFVQTFGKLIDQQEKYNLARSSQGRSSKELAELDAKYARSQISSYASMAGAAKGFFGQKTAGYKVLMVAEQGLRALELASTAQRIAEKAAEGSVIAAVGVANQAAGDPYTAFPRMAAMAAAMAGLGFAVGGIGGGGGSFAPTNTGTGTVLGDPSAKSESINKSIDALREVDTLTMRYSAAMLASLQSIEGNIGGLATLLIRGGNLDAASAGIKTGFEQDSLGKLFSSRLGSGQLASMIGGAVLGPVGAIAGFALDSILGGAVGKLLGGLFGTKTSIKGQGIAAGPQSIESILAGGFDASYFADIEKKKKFLGVTTSTKRSTKYTDADPLLESQVATIFSGFSDAVLAAAQPLGASLDLVKKSISGFVVNIGRVDLKDLNGTEMQERLSAVFGAQGDKLAEAALAGFESFQKVGEGYLETVVRVASGLEQARVTLARLGIAAADVSAITKRQGDVSAELVRQSILAVDGIGGVAEIMKTLDGSASDLGETYKALTDVRLSLRLLGLDAASIGFDLVNGAGGLDSLADAISAFETGFLSNDAQVTTKAQRLADQFTKLGLSLPSSSDAFVAMVRGIDTSTAAGKALLGGVLSLSGGFSDLLDSIKDVGGGIQDEIERIRGLGVTSSAKTMAELQAEFAIKTASARAGDQASIDALPQISQALLKAAEATAGSNIDVAVIQAQTLASLQATLNVISDPTKRLGRLPGFASGGDFMGGWRLVGEHGPEIEATGPARIYSASQTARILAGSQRDDATRAEVAALREELKLAMAPIAANTGKTVRILEGVTPNGNQMSVVIE